MPAENKESTSGYQPSLRDMVMVNVPAAVRINADGSKIAIKVHTTNWRENRYEHRCTVFDLATETTQQITRTGDVQQMAWVDSQTLALQKKDLEGNGEAQVWLYKGLAGEGWAVTNHKNGVEWFEPFAGGLLYLARDSQREEKRKRAAKFGKYVHFEQEESSLALYYVDLERLKEYRQQEKACTEEEAEDLVMPVIELSQLLEEPLAIQSVYPSPAGDAVYLNCWTRDDLVYRLETSSYQISLDADAAVSEYIQRQTEKSTVADSGEEKDEAEDDLSYLGTISRLNLPRAAYLTAVSPDGKRLLVYYQGRDEKMYTLGDLWLIELENATNASTPEDFLDKMVNISAPLDREVLERQWAEGGVFGTYVDSTKIHLARFGEDEVRQIELDGRSVSGGFHASDAGNLTFIGANSTTFPEVYLIEPAHVDGSRPIKQITKFGQALESWDLGTVETVRWLSKDGTEIEGVLRKPSNFDPQHHYPLVFVVHGGPRWFSEEYLIGSYELAYYPGVQFVNKDFLVLQPNYRGSLGRGQAFAELNVDNLGTGDLWDLESGIEHMANLGFVDEKRVGCMGWSQGGYISAFAGLHSDKFAAISVGAGIADWYTYHISTDIPDFTVDYLSVSPFRAREAYEKSAPLSNIAKAQTPTLIQHGSDDRRVPVSNAMELYRALKEMGVPVELFIFPGMGHPITKPRENHAVMFQNLNWFSHYLLGEELQLE